MQKEDIALAATGARSYERHWRVRKLSWNAIGKLWYLLYGAIEYMDEVTLCYPQEKFNKLRTALGFKQDSELVALVETAESFRIIRNKDTGEMMAFLTPMVPSRFVLSESQVAEEALRIYIERELIGHMSRRVGIENWPSEAIQTWLRNIFGVKRLDYLMTAVKQTWDKYVAFISL